MITSSTARGASIACAVFGLFVNLCALDLRAASETISSKSISNSPLEQFKAFLPSPPVIENLVFRVKLNQDTAKARALDGSFALSTNYAYFQARVQESAVLLRRLINPNETAGLIADGQFISIFGREFCLVDNALYADHWVRPPNSLKHDSPISNIAHRRLGTLRQVLNLGIMHLEIGALRWDGKCFQGECGSASKRLGMRTVSGELVTTTTGPPTAMKVTYLGENSSWNYLIKYSYGDDTQRSWFPSRIACFLLRDGKEIERNEFVNLELRISEHPQPAQAFSPSEYIAANGWQMRFYTNNALYAMMPDGQLKLVATRSTEGLPVKLSSRPSAMRWSLAYCAWTGANFWILIQVVRMKKQQIKKPQHEGAI